MKARNGAHLDPARERPFVPPLAAAQRIVAEDRDPRVAQRANPDVESSVMVAALERDPPRGAEGEPARRAGDVPGRDVVLPGERALAGAGEAECHPFEVAARSAPESDLIVGHVPGSAGELPVVPAEREAEPRSRREAPLVHVIRPDVLVRPEEGELRLVEDSPLRRVERRPDRAVVGRGRRGENVRLLGVRGEALPRGGSAGRAEEDHRRRGGGE